MTGETQVWPHVFIIWTCFYWLNSFAFLSDTLLTRYLTVCSHYYLLYYPWFRVIQQLLNYLIVEPFVRSFIVHPQTSRLCFLWIKSSWLKVFLSDTGRALSYLLWICEQMKKKDPQTLRSHYSNCIPFSKLLWRVAILEKLTYLHQLESTSQ